MRPPKPGVPDSQTPSQEPAELPHTVQELQAHRAQLAMQNEELRATRARVDALLAQYTVLYDFAPVGYVTLDRAAVIQQVNLAAAAMLGVERNRLMGRRLALFVTEADRPVFDEFMLSIFRTTTRHWCEVRSPREGIATLVVRIEGTRLGEEETCRAVLLDMTLRQQAQDALRESERFARGTLDALSANIAVLDEAGVIISINRSWSRFAHQNGGTPSAVGVGVNYLEVVERATVLDRETSGRFAQGLRAVLAGGQEEFLLEYPCHSPTQQRWFLSRTTRFGDDGPVRVVVAHEDITHRVVAEHSAQLARDRLQLAITAGNVGLWDWDLATHKVTYSAEWKRQIGYAEDEIGDDFDEWQSRVHPEDLPPTLAKVRAFLDTGERDFESEFRFRHKDGSYRHILAQAKDVRGEDGKRVRVVGSHIDITAQVQLQAQFLQSQQMETVGHLAGGVAHDFNNLLTFIIGSADLAMSSLPAGHPVRADLDSILRAGEQGSALTSHLLAFSRLQVTKPQVVDLNAALDRLRGMLRRVLGEHIELVVKLESSDCSVFLDPVQLEQVVMNLVVNARDAMPNGGTLTLETQTVQQDAVAVASDPTRAAELVRLCCRDTGVGMDEATRLRVFDPFFTTKAHRGTGLGLSTVRGIVLRCGGEVSLSSALGEGTTFVIDLPRVAPELEPPREEAPRTGDRGTETVLLVEDEAQVRTLVTRLLERSGYRVLAASHGDEALALVKRRVEPIALLLTDIVMPRMNGVTLATRLAELRPQVKVLFMSGYTGDVRISDEALDEAHFIGKPFNIAQLSRKVRQVLDA